MKICKVDGCESSMAASGYCNLHYKRWKRHGDPHKTLAKPKREVTGKGECSIDGCTRPKDTRGWCRLHYGRWQRHGDPLTEPDYSRKPKDKLPDELPDHLAGWLQERRERLGRDLRASNSRPGRGAGNGMLIDSRGATTTIRTVKR